MRTITIKNLVIQVDVKGEDPVNEAREAIALINQTLQRDPNCLGAHIMESAIDADDVSSDDFSEDVE